MGNSDETEQYALEFETESCSYSRLPVDSRRYLEPILLCLQREREREKKRKKEGKWKEGVILTESIVIARFLYLPQWKMTFEENSFADVLVIWYLPNISPAKSACFRNDKGPLVSSVEGKWLYLQ